jgi:tRNA(fMet)-specific endonuclease VapC
VERLLCVGGSLKGTGRFHARPSGCAAAKTESFLSLYLLDTNIASHIIKGNFPAARKRLAALSVDAEVAVSAVTQAELLYGLAKRDHPANLTVVIREFLLRVNVLSWNSDAANTYGDLRAACETAGLTLGSLDMMIAAHAKATGAILVTRDKSFKRIARSQGLKLENWTV